VFHFLPSFPSFISSFSPPFFVLFSDSFRIDPPFHSPTIFLVIMTNFILLIGAGLFTKSITVFQSNACVPPKNRLNILIGAQIDDTGGTGPGSYDVRNDVWHLDRCNPNGNLVFNAILGRTNDASCMSPLFCCCYVELTFFWEVGSILAYVLWVAAAVVLVYMKFKEVGSFLSSLLPVFLSQLSPHPI
jgi:hypothetical protein